MSAFDLPAVITSDKPVSRIRRFLCRIGLHKTINAPAKLSEWDNWVIGYERCTIPGCDHRVKLILNVRDSGCGPKHEVCQEEDLPETLQHAPKSA